MDIEAALQPIVDDPEAYYQREILPAIVMDKGQDWVDAHLHEVRNGWEAARFIFEL